MASCQSQVVNFFSGIIGGLDIELKYSPIIIKQEIINIINGQTAYETLLSNWNMDTIELYEEFKMLLLNRANEDLGIHTMSRGGLSRTVVDLKQLFAVVLKSASSSIMLAHNHPSGNLKPRVADIGLQRKIKKAAKYFDVQLLDNIIITKDGFYSFFAIYFHDC